MKGSNKKEDEGRGASGGTGRGEGGERDGGWKSESDKKTEHYRRQSKTMSENSGG